MFLSPYGVSFILIDLIFQSYNTVIAIIVSVSLRSIIHSYEMERQGIIEVDKKESFRLLTEYYSFLYKWYSSF